MLTSSCESHPDSASSAPISARPSSGSARPNDGPSAPALSDFDQCAEALATSMKQVDEAVERMAQAARRLHAAAEAMLRRARKNRNRFDDPAVVFMRRKLTNGAMPACLLIEWGANEGICYSALYRASQVLRLRKRRGPGGIYWELPPEFAPQPATPS